MLKRRLEVFWRTKETDKDCNEKTRVKTDRMERESEQRRMRSNQRRCPRFGRWTDESSSFSPSEDTTHDQHQRICIHYLTCGGTTDRAFEAATVNMMFF